MPHTPHGECRFIPCRIGDTAWGIRNRFGVKHPKRGVVSEIYFVQTSPNAEMSLAFTVKGVCRGEWGKQIFPSEKAAEEYIVRTKAKSVDGGGLKTTRGTSSPR